MHWRKATGWCHGPHRVLPIYYVYLGRSASANKILHLARYSEGVECVWGNGHIWRE